MEWWCGSGGGNSVAVECVGDCGVVVLVIVVIWWQSGSVVAVTIMMIQEKGEKKEKDRSKGGKGRTKIRRKTEPIITPNRAQIEIRRQPQQQQQQLQMKSEGSPLPALIQKATPT